MARFVPEVLEHIGLFTPAMQKKLRALETLENKRRLTIGRAKTLRLPQRDYDLVIATLKGHGYDVARGVKLNERKLAALHPLSASKNIPDILALPKGLVSGNKVRITSVLDDIRKMLPSLKGNVKTPRIQVHEVDYDELTDNLSEQGFDVSRGIKADGVQVTPLSPA